VVALLFRGWRTIVECAVRSLGVVVLPPFLNQNLDFFQCVEDLPIEQFSPSLRIGATMDGPPLVIEGAVEGPSKSVPLSQCPPVRWNTAACAAGPGSRAVVITRSSCPSFGRSPIVVNVPENSLGKTVLVSIIASTMIVSVGGGCANDVWSGVGDTTMTINENIKLSRQNIIPPQSDRLSNR